MKFNKEELKKSLDILDLAEVLDEDTYNCILNNIEDLE